MRFKQFLILEAREDYVASAMGNKLLQAFNNDSGRKPNQKLTPRQIVQYWSNAGPQFIQWIAKQYVNGNIRWEDFPQVKQDILTFQQLVKANAIKIRDINRFATISDLRTQLKNTTVGSLDYTARMEKLYQALIKSVQSGHGKWILNTSDPIKIYTPTDIKGSQIIRTAYPSISWCTTCIDDPTEMNKQVSKIIQDEFQQKKQAIEREWDENGVPSYQRRMDWDELWDETSDEVADDIDAGAYDEILEDYRKNRHDYYIKRYGGDYYVILTPDGPYQFHFESDQFKDQTDQDVDVNTLIQKYPIIKSILSPIINDKGHPHFNVNNTTDKVSNKKQVIKALKASFKNAKYVNAENLNKNDWIDVFSNILKTQGGGLNERGLIAESWSLLNEFYKILQQYKFKVDDIVNVFETLIEKYPNQITQFSVPKELLDKMSPKITKLLSK